MLIAFTLNGRPTSVTTDPTRPLLDVLRQDLRLTGTKQGCDHEGECGACTVLMDGAAVRSCLTPVGKVSGRDVVTVEGLAHGDRLHPLQVAFIETGAVQCGFCTPGMLLSAKALLDRQPSPTRTDIIEALDGNLCRCTGYAKIVQAVVLSAAGLRGEAPAEPAEPHHPPMGGSELRSDSRDKVTGQALYAEDMAPPGMLYGKVLRSHLHHARLRELDATDARAFPGVYGILTADDVPGLNGFPAYSREEPVLPEVNSTLRMVGAPIALVVAETAQHAEAAVTAIRVSLEELPHTFETNCALETGAFPIAGRSNVLATFEAAHGDLEGALSNSDHLLDTAYDTAFLEHAALERETLLGYPEQIQDPDGRQQVRITVVGGTHEPHYQQDYIAQALALPLEQVRVIIPPTGGTFGGKQDPWPFIATALMVYHTGRPVRLAYSRHESFDASPKRHPYRVRYRIGANQDGQLTGIRVRIDCNTGGYDGHGQYIANYALTAAGGPYRWTAVDGMARSVYTNGPKSGQYRGFGTAQSTFALECALDELAQALDQDPWELRWKNALADGERSFLGYPLADSVGYRPVLEAIRPDYQRFLHEAAHFNASHAGQPLRRGVGLAGMWYRFGKSGSLRVEAHAELALDGHLIVYCSAPDYGQGTNTVISQIAAEAFGVSRRQVEVINADTARVPASGIQGASRATFFVGGAVSQVVTHLRQETLGTAAEMLDQDPRRLTLVDDRIGRPDDPCQQVTLAQVAEEFQRSGKARRLIGFFDLSDEFPRETRPEYIPLFVTGAHLADVAVNLETGETEVRRMVAAHDVGRAVNRPDAEGQVEGSVLMGLGAALMEEHLPGQTTGFADYYLPTASSMPAIKVILVETPSRYGPYGAKGLGEAAMLPATPAIINAMSRAVGARLHSIPATPERVLAVVRRELQATQ